MSRIRIFVEGDDDQKFIEDFLKIIDRSLPDVKVIPVEGWTKLHAAQPQFTTNTELGGTNLIIFDADDDFTQRTNDIRSKIGELGIQSELFLFPNNADSGNLDTLLVSISNPAFHPVHECFDNYSASLAASNLDLRLPNIKHKIYTYLYSIKGDPRATKRNFLIPEHWNLKSHLLNNLKTFLSDKIMVNV